MIPADFTPNFSKGGGLVPVVTQSAQTGLVLMLAYMNEEAWKATLKTGIAHYYSRSRKALWRKGATSGNEQLIKAVRLDCDNDTVLLLVEQKGGAACHTGHESCFYRELKNGSVTECCPVLFDPKEVYDNGTA